VRLDVAGREALGVEGDDVAGEAIEAALALGDGDRVEAAVPVAGACRSTGPMSVVTVLG
jgi:hypothetical protein